MPTRKASDSEDNLDTQQSKRVKTASERPGGLFFVTTPQHTKRPLEDPSSAVDNASKRSRSLKPPASHTIDNGSNCLSKQQDQTDPASKRRQLLRRLKPKTAEPAAALVPSEHLVEYETDDIDTEVERRLAQSERRRKDRLEGNKDMNGMQSTAKRKRDSGDSTEYIESALERDGVFAISKKRRKRLKRKTAHDTAADSTRNDRNGASCNGIEHLSLHKTKRLRATFEMLDGTVDSHEVMDEETERQRKKIALSVS